MTTRPRRFERPRGQVRAALHDAMTRVEAVEAMRGELTARVGAAAATGEQALRKLESGAPEGSGGLPGLVRRLEASAHGHSRAIEAATKQLQVTACRRPQSLAPSPSPPVPDACGRGLAAVSQPIGEVRVESHALPSSAPPHRCVPTGWRHARTTSRRCGAPYRP